MAHVSAIDPLHSVEHITVPEVRFLTRIREEERIHRSIGPLNGPDQRPAATRSLCLATGVFLEPRAKQPSRSVAAIQFQHVQTT